MFNRISRDVKKYRPCVPQISNSCMKKVYGYMENRTCINCKLVQKSLQNPALDYLTPEEDLFKQTVPGVDTP